VAEDKELAEAAEAAEEKPEAIEEAAAPSVEQESSAEAASDATPMGSAEAGTTEPTEEVAAEEATEAPEPADRVPPLAQLDGLDRRTDVYYYGTGRRKMASAQVRLYPSKEPTIIVNDMPAGEYFSRESDILLLTRPLQATATADSFRITVKVRGGGITGQAAAVRHGIARALTKADPDLRRTLRREGSLTRDPRTKERKKPGLKRARKAPQYTKR
jgi:small subunit ribosomal protein S9